MNRSQLLDHYFIDARARLIDLGAFMDRVQRADGAEDFRMEAFRHACEILLSAEPEKAARILRAFSDLSVAPVASAGKPACGAARVKEQTP